MKFKNANSEDLNEELIEKSKSKEVAVTLNKVTVYVKQDEEENLTENMSLVRLLEVLDRKPQLLIKVKPPIYSVYKSTKTGKLEPYVKVGDTVRYAKPIYLPVGRKITDTFTVLSVELSGLGSMSVFTATLDNGDVNVLTNYLKKQ